MTERFTPSPAHVEAIQLNADGTNWRDFDGWVGWDILETAKVWTTPNPESVRSLEILLCGDIDNDDDEWGEMERGDWLVRTDDGRLAILSEDAFGVLFDRVNEPERKWSQCMSRQPHEEHTIGLAKTLTWCRGIEER